MNLSIVGLTYSLFLIRKKRFSVFWVDSCFDLVTLFCVSLSLDPPLYIALYNFFYSFLFSLFLDPLPRGVMAHVRVVLVFCSSLYA